MIVIAGTAKIRAETIAAALDAGSRMAAASRREVGCHDYRFAVDVDDPHTVHLFERWEDQATLEAHFTTPHFADFSARIVEFLASEPTFTRYEVASSGPLFG